MAGFTCAEGCFFVVVGKSNSCRTGFRVKLVFSLVQHKRDEQLMRSFIEYFKCGQVIKDRDTYKFLVIKFSDQTEIIIPFFQKYPIIGVKCKDFEDFSKVAELMKSGAHLTPDGLENVRKIKAGMNKGR